MMIRKRSVDRSMFYNASPEIFRRAKELRENLTVDFYCHKARLVIEIDGEVHENKEQFERDQGRSSELNEFGLKVLRFTNQEVLESIEVVLKIINQTLSDSSRELSPLQGI